MSGIRLIEERRLAMRRVLLRAAKVIQRHGLMLDPPGGLITGGELAHEFRECAKWLQPERSFARGLRRTGPIRRKRTAPTGEGTR